MWVLGYQDRRWERKWWNMRGNDEKWEGMRGNTLLKLLLLFMTIVFWYSKMTMIVEFIILCSSETLQENDFYCCLPLPLLNFRLFIPYLQAKLGIANGEKFICYMCYETHDTAEVTDLMEWPVSFSVPRSHMKWWDVIGYLLLSYLILLFGAVR